MKIVGYLGTQRYPKGKNIYDKNGNINENYIFAFDPTNTLGNTKNISSVKVRNPNMALVVNDKVCIDYDDTEKNDYGTTITNCRFVYSEKIFNKKYQKDAIIKKLPISNETKAILISREDALGDIIRYANPHAYAKKPRVNEKEQPIEHILDSDVLKKLINLVPDADADDYESMKLEEIKEKLKPAIANMDKTKKEKIIKFIAATDRPESVYEATSDLKIQFNTADNIAACMGITNNDPRRIKAYITHALNDVAKTTGNSYMLKKFLKTVLNRNIKNRDNANYTELITPTDVDNTLKSMEDKELIFDGTYGDKVYTRYMWDAEKLISEKLATLATNPTKKLDDEDITVDEKLDEIQKDAVMTAIKNNISVITGGPGTGKTTIISNIIKNTKKMDYQTILLAPTGKAANRMSESTSHDAHTIDKLIASQTMQEEILHDHIHIIIDEVSMVATEHMSRLLKLLNDKNIRDIKFTFVGDTNQLQSIAPGRILADFASTFNTTHLQNVYRQGGNSTINKVAKTVIQGKPITNLIPPSSSFQYNMDIVKLECSPEDITGWIDQLTNDIIPVLWKNKKETIDPINDIQILTPYATKNQFLSTAQINEVLNEGDDFKIGSKVIQTVNDYDKGVMNGEIGEITYYDPTADETDPIVTVKYNKRTVDYFKDDLADNQITLANAITIHKSQGSEFKVIILPISSNQQFMMNRKMFYTEITRAKELCILVGQTNLLDVMVTKAAPERLSDLARKIQTTIDKEKEKQKETQKMVDDISNNLEYDDYIEYEYIPE